MPELPEVERAASLTREIAQGRVIERVETTEDNLVYKGTTHDEFFFAKKASVITGRKVMGVGRYGKVFYINLDGEGPSPVLHLGMTGMLQVKGREPTYYRERPQKQAIEAWPPRFMKFILHISATSSSPSAQLAFIDARRLGRIRLCTYPMAEPPISKLGFDPLLSMPNLEDYTKSIRKRSCTIKSLLLDQSFNAGIGNWVADEILYQAHVHPEQGVKTLTDTEVMELHRKTVEICRKAVEVNADSSRFPEDWLFKHRWGKGKNLHTLLLPNGGPATIKWTTVGGRTSAYVAELQILSKKDATAAPHVKGDLISDGELTPLSDAEPEVMQSNVKRKASKVSKATMGQLSPGSRKSKRVRTFVLKGSRVMEEVEAASKPQEQ